MRLVNYYFTDETDTIKGEIEVASGLTDEEVNDLILDAIAESIKGNRWSVDWDYVN